MQMIRKGNRRWAPMKIIIPGGSGHVGSLLARAFHERGDEVVVLSRTKAEADSLAGSDVGWRDSSGMGG
mgnify:CR=1 FL=1